ncbi:hypothetical protein [Geomicrobium sp. JCM 19039]|uniref:hypothetical protein n=1 Tax=Geomicrobium sp. JCM 19039 TaxID=1460636 RepID=UPI0005AA011B|nr:hypothetical protein [Geomicrobium sp. JCM 19039]
MNYYILSLKRTSGDVFTWWRPDCRGYTQDLNKAGIYTEEELQERPWYFSNENAMPVEVGIVDRSLKATVVINDSSNQIVFAEQLEHQNLREAK